MTSHALYAVVLGLIPKYHMVPTLIMGFILKDRYGSNFHAFLGEAEALMKRE